MATRQESLCGILKLINLSRKVEHYHCLSNAVIITKYLGNQDAQCYKQSGVVCYYVLCSAVSSKSTECTNISHEHEDKYDCRTLNRVAIFRWTFAILLC